MNINLLDDDLAAVARLNPSIARPLDQVTLLRSEASLERILATNPATVSSSGPVRRFAPLRLARWAFVPVAAALAITLVTNIGGPGAPAFAETWTAIPAALSATDLSALTQVCEVTVQGWDDSVDTRAVPAPTISEQRADWALAAYVLPADAAHPEQVVGLCLARQVAGVWEFRVGLSKRGVPVGLANGPSIAEGTGVALVTDLSQPIRIMAEGKVVESGAVAAAFGQVGADVAHLVIHMPTGDITATVNDGWFVAWWPEGSAYDSVRRATGYTVTTTDGTVLPRVAVDWSRWGYELEG